MQGALQKRADPARRSQRGFPLHPKMIRSVPVAAASLYAAMAQFWLRDLGSGEPTQVPLIPMDWSDLNEARGAQLIRASVARRGRSLTYGDCVQENLSHAFEDSVCSLVVPAFLNRTQDREHVWRFNARHLHSGARVRK